MSVHNELEYFQITYNRGSALYYLKNELGYDLINCWSLSMLDEVDEANKTIDVTEDTTV